MYASARTLLNDITESTHTETAKLVLLQECEDTEHSVYDEAVESSDFVSVDTKKSIIRQSPFRPSLKDFQDQLHQK